MTKAESFVITFICYTAPLVAFLLAACAGD